jgi:hypothetical protein
MVLRSVMQLALRSSPHGFAMVVDRQRHPGTRFCSRETNVQRLMNSGTAPSIEAGIANRLATAARNNV